MKDLEVIPEFTAWKEGASEDAAEKEDSRDWPAKRLITLESQNNPQGFQGFTDLIREGIADGSLRPDLVPDLTLHAIINACDRRAAPSCLRWETKSSRNTASPSISRSVKPFA